MPERTSPAGADAGNAMREAVAAEQAARVAISEADAAAAAAVEAAHARARAILNAVPGRVMRLRERGARTVQKALGAIAAEEAATMTRLRGTEHAVELLDRAVARVVQRLSGDES